MLFHEIQVQYFKIYIPHKQKGTLGSLLSNALILQITNRKLKRSWDFHWVTELVRCRTKPPTRSLAPEPGISPPAVSLQLSNFVLLDFQILLFLPVPLRMAWVSRSSPRWPWDLPMKTHLLCFSSFSGHHICCTVLANFLPAALREA